MRTGYSRATHRNKFEGTPDPDCQVCSAKLTLDNILWQRKEGRKTKKVCAKGEEGAKMLVEYVKNIGL
jgi:hypothetical protein